MANLCDKVCVLIELDVKIAIDGIEMVSAICDMVTEIWIDISSKLRPWAKWTIGVACIIMLSIIALIISIVGVVIIVIGNTYTAIISFGKFLLFKEPNIPINVDSTPVDFKKTHRGGEYCTCHTCGHIGYLEAIPTSEGVSHGFCGKCGSNNRLVLVPISPPTDK